MCLEWPDLTRKLIRKTFKKNYPPTPEFLVFFEKKLKELRIVDLAKKMTRKTCGKTNFRSRCWGAKRRVKRAQTWERGPPSAPDEFDKNVPNTFLDQKFDIEEDTCMCSELQYYGRDSAGAQRV